MICRSDLLCNTFVSFILQQPETKTLVHVVDANRNKAAPAAVLSGHSNNSVVSAHLSSCLLIQEEEEIDIDL